MRNLLIIIIILLSGKLSATPELDYFSYNGEHISIDVIYRYKNDIKELYYKSLTENLDKYLDSLKQLGLLERGKVHFEIMTGIWMDAATGVQMYRYKNGYYCWLNGLVQPISQDYLTRIIKYFASDSWQSFCYNDSLVSPSVAVKIFNKRIDKIKPDYRFEKTEIYKLNYINLCYHNDSLICYLANKNFGSIDKFLPFSTDSIDFFTIDSTIYVIDNNEVLNTIELTENDFYGDGLYQCEIEKYPKWINFKNYGGYFLSYSLKKNKFYKL